MYNLIIRYGKMRTVAFRRMSYYIQMHYIKPTCVKILNIKIKIENIWTLMRIIMSKYDNQRQHLAARCLSEFPLNKHPGMFK